MKKSLVGILFLVFGLFIISGFADDIKYDMNFTKETSCEIRKIKLYENPAWVSKIDFKNGKSAFFCSPKSMFEFYFDIQRWATFDAKELSDFKNILVTDYKSLKTIDARKAFFVYGSHDISPAGDDLVAFESKEEAQKFLENNNGKRIFDFDGVLNSLIRLLNGRI
jgi:copper chaperone NosL